MTFATAPQDHPRAAPIERATGVSLATWTQRLDDAGARDLDHTAIARLLPQRWEIIEWWAQAVTVAYEQIIGRRVVGQSSAGDFAASASRTVPGDMDTVRAAWHDFMTAQRRGELGLGEPRLSDSASWRYWRADVTDGTTASVNITTKSVTITTKTDPAGAVSAPRSTLGIEHKGIETADGRDVWKAAWKQALTDFTAALKETR